jgi:hypothetical protein
VIANRTVGKIVVATFYEDICMVIIITQVVSIIQHSETNYNTWLIIVAPMVLKPHGEYKIYTIYVKE